MLEAIIGHYWNETMIEMIHSCNEDEWHDCRASTWTYSKTVFTFLCAYSYRRQNILDRFSSRRVRNIMLNNIERNIQRNSKLKNLASIKFLLTCPVTQVTLHVVVASRHYATSTVIIKYTIPVMIKFLLTCPVSQVILHIVAAATSTIIMKIHNSCNDNIKIII